ncbi:3-deoxy-manno-octulosonate cytidylyltransferase [Marimonas arenosa]|uniref:3-deoxy-manno-octulosonate cytidylyltransferase n=1 Tax=Marimonas arenosa TaxID=1795305 RepID=A0AAE3WBT6_9RHOB|nr:3-deoxy-manno-octulosonate cytidylyltransferase [Marimonas arenosa]MDQ2090056.1 3-deoxy-manno-octulosonate cytidylyltransferase [Marimonas arenosa]
MKTVIIIPARYASTRYPGKPLVELEDATGTRKSLVQRSWEAAMAVAGVAEVYIATDDDRIRAAAQGFGAQVIMTSEKCDNGTARCADAVEKAGLDADLVINLQGDAPLTPAWFVEDLIAAMASRPDAQMATPVLKCDAETYRHFREDRAAGRVGGTTAVFGSDNHALYFSKEVIPYIDPGKQAEAFGEVFHHVGLYAYRPEALHQYVTWPPGRLEKLEGLEQLRFLEHGIPVLCVEVEGRGRVFWELNNPEDVPRIEKVLKALR